MNCKFCKSESERRLDDLERKLKEIISQMNKDDDEYAELKSKLKAIQKIRLSKKAITLEKVESDLLKEINRTDPKDPEYVALLEDLKQVQDMKNNERDSKNKETFIERVVKWIIGLMVPITAYGIWLREGFNFEINNTVRSSFLRNLLGKLKPSK